MDRCFIIQPFDNDKYDKRFDDVFKPAITNAGLDPYRVDRDYSVRIPIEEIENGIVESTFCFAEISTDNPNVWYELGYAFACNKEVIIVCSEERQKFPFDIQHRQIIKYKTGSISDFNELKENITKRIIALKATSKTVTQLASAPVVETEGLKSHEIALLILMMEDQILPEQSSFVHHLKNEMSKAGYNDVATAVGLRTLAKYGMIENFKDNNNWNQEEYPVARLTVKGEEWILTNQNQLQFRKPEQKFPEEDRLPF